MLLCISSPHCLCSGVSLVFVYCPCCVIVESVTMAALLCRQLLAGRRVAPGPAVLQGCCCKPVWLPLGMSVLSSVISTSSHLGLGSCVSDLHDVGCQAWGNDGGCQNEVGGWRVCWGDQHPESRNHIIEIVPRKAFPVCGVSHVGSLQGHNG